MRRLPLAVLALLAVLGLSSAYASTARAAAPTVTLTSPANGAYITGAQPTFSGRADGGPDATDRVSVSISAGTSPSSTAPVQVLDVPVSSSGSYRVAATALADGTYTAVASEADQSGNLGRSASVTFVVFNGTPTLSLHAPAATITTSVPTFAGRAGTAASDGSSAFLAIYAGDGTDTTPLAVLTAPVRAGGRFTIPVQPGLADGTYTVVAGQPDGSVTGFSPPVTVHVAARGSALSLRLTAGTTLPQTAVSFHGGAGNDLGDDPVIDLALYRGKAIRGTPLGRASAPRTGSVWNLSWPTALAPGTYTVLVLQGDVAHRYTTVARTFEVAVPITVTTPQITHDGTLRARLHCLPGAGVCRGDLLILTEDNLRTVVGGPLGRLSLLFHSLAVPAGATRTLSVRLTPAQDAALVQAGPTPLSLTVIYRLDGQIAEASRISGFDAAP